MVHVEPDLIGLLKLYEESKEKENLFVTWASGCQHGQGFLVLLFPSKPLEELSLTLQQAEGATEASVKHIMNT